VAWHERIDSLQWTALKGVAEGVSITKLLGIAFEKQSRGSHELRWSAATIRPGGKFSHHAHPHPQCFYFVKGTGEVALDGDVLPVGPGSIVTVADREGHEVRNTGDAEMFLMEVSLFHDRDAVPAIVPHPAVAAPEERQAGLAERLHGMVAAEMRRRTDESAARPRKAAAWLQATRPFSFTASVVPVLLGTVLGAVAGGIHPWLAVVALVGGLAIHAGANLVSDYYDFRNGVDAEDTYGSSGVLTGRLLTPQEVFLGGLLAFAIAAAAGAYLTTVRGPIIVLLGVVGILGGFFYTARPVGYKYRALGDIGIFLLFGPLMVLGAYIVQTGTFSWMPLVVALPVGFLVTAILHANNLRDVPFDDRAGIRTLAMVAGGNGSRAIYAALLVGAYAAVIAFSVLGILPLLALAALLSAPIAVRNLRLIARASSPGEMALADVMTAQLHMVFGVLLTLGVVVGSVL
jgi:1,4-dihydroxy-2-naphthoate octaprenyltransferase